MNYVRNNCVISKIDGFETVLNTNIFEELSYQLALRRTVMSGHREGSPFWLLRSILHRNKPRIRRLRDPVARWPLIFIALGQSFHI